MLIVTFYLNIFANIVVLWQNSTKVAANVGKLWQKKVKTQTTALDTQKIAPEVVCQGTKEIDFQVFGILWSREYLS